MEKSERSELYQDFVKTVQAFCEQNTPSGHGITWRDFFQSTFEEVQWQVADWYGYESYYRKPEDILQDFFHLSAEDAHRFLPLFNGD